MQVECFIEAVADAVAAKLHDHHREARDYYQQVLTYLRSINERMLRLVSIQDDINAALAGDEAAITALAQRVADLQNVFTTQNAGLQEKLSEADKHITDLETQIAAGGAIDTTALKAALASIKDHADAIAAIAAAPPATTPAAPPPASAPTAGPQPVGGKPLYTLSGDIPIDANWTLTDLRTVSDGLLYTYGPDNPGGPATGDGLGGVWHLYTGDVEQVPAG